MRLEHLNKEELMRHAEPETELEKALMTIIEDEFGEVESLEAHISELEDCECEDCIEHENDKQDLDDEIIDLNKKVEKLEKKIEELS